MTKTIRKVNVGVMSAFYATLILGSVASFLPDATGQTYPTKPIRIVATTTPGASSDIIARLIAAKLSEALGQQFVVDNRAGAGGRIGTEMVARAAPDGYTLLMMTGQVAINSAMYKDLRYDIIKDFSPISLAGTTVQVLMVNPSVPATSVKELVALAKALPGMLKYGSSGSGNTPHLAAEIFKSMTGTDILHVPYKGATPALTSTMTGEVDMSLLAITMSVPMIKSGKVRALGVTSLKRTPLFPDLPAIAESVPGYEFMLWQGLAAPAKTPPAILSKLNTEVVKALNTSAVREQMAAIGNEPSGCSQKDFALFLSRDLEKMREAVRLSGAKPED